MKASRLIGRRDYFAAGAVYERIMACDPHDSFAVLMLAHCYKNQGRLPDALHLAEEVVRQLPENLEALKTAVCIAVAIGDHEKASAYVERALSLPEVRTGVPHEIMPKWALWLLRGLAHLPYFRRRIRGEDLADFEEGKSADKLRAWKQWALEYQAWRRGRSNEPLEGGNH